MQSHPMEDIFGVAASMLDIQKMDSYNRNTYWLNVLHLLWIFCDLPGKIACTPMTSIN